MQQIMKATDVDYLDVGNLHISLYHGVKGIGGYFKVTISIG